MEEVCLDDTCTATETYLQLSAEFKCAWHMNCMFDVSIVLLCHGMEQTASVHLVCPSLGLFKNILKNVKWVLL